MKGRSFCEKTPVLDQFGQWAASDWPRKIKSAEQLKQELADEEKSFGTPRGFWAWEILWISGYASEGDGVFPRRAD